MPLKLNVADRHTTVCVLNNILASRYELRYLVISHGSDTLGLAALSVANWQELEKTNATAAAESFIDSGTLPNVETDLSEEDLPSLARARYQRMVDRHR